VGYSATVVKVMLASPGDVSQERRLARDVIHEWNAVHAEDRHVVLMPIGWESNAFPEMGDRAQAVINKQILKDCDLLVAVFWTRLGTPTGSSPSGTVEEIEEHLAARKPALIYFSAAPVRLDSVDGEQYEALTAFKESCRQRGLVETYDDLAAFKDKFSRHLAQVVIQKFGDSIPAAEVAKDRRPSGPALSEAAQQLLLEAASDTNGTVVMLASLDGLSVDANHRNFVEHDNPRSEAKWRGAVNELHGLGLIEDRGGKGELFYVTDRGYALADELGGSAVAT
jgi:hypothetical protein